MKYAIAIVFSVFVLTGFSQTPSAKRGLAYGNHKPADLEALANGLSWYYNWYHKPESTVINVYEDYNFDFVPMAWNGAFDQQGMRDFLSTHPNVKYILGFNEPNFIDQANLTPSEAAAHWPDIEAIADEFNLEIVGPAVNYCGNCVSEGGTTYTDPIKYLDDFFAACQGCRVDHIAIHCYMADVSALQWYVGLFKKYEKPIWLTEFAAWERTPTLLQQKNFMVGAVDYLESDPDVFRYAWFTGRFDNVSPYIGLLQNLGNLTELGGIYVNMPLHDPSVYTTIPALIEAEAHNKMSGVKLEATQDVSGYANVAYIDASDWMEYNIDVPESGTYAFNVRLASTQAGTIRVDRNGQTLSTVNFTNTGSWQTWKTFHFTLDLEAGEQTLRLIAPSGGFNLNWIELTEEVVLDTEDQEENSITLYPNPTSDRLYIDAGSQWEKFELLNLIGVKCVHGDVTSFVDLNALARGPYLMKFVNRDGRTVFKKVMKQ